LKTQAATATPPVKDAQNASAASAVSIPQNAASSDTGLQNLVTRERQLRSQMTASRLAKNPELPAAAMSFVFDVEEQTASICGEPSGLDQALLLIGRNREGVER
jgi:hypothetical protein